MQHRDKTIMVTEVLLQNKNDEGEKMGLQQMGTEEAHLTSF